jgi:hypothetical protein
MELIENESNEGSNISEEEVIILRESLRSDDLMEIIMSNM